MVLWLAGNWSFTGPGISSLGIPVPMQKVLSVAGEQSWQAFLSRTARTPLGIDAAHLLLEVPKNLLRSWKSGTGPQRAGAAPRWR